MACQGRPVRGPGCWPELPRAWHLLAFPAYLTCILAPCQMVRRGKEFLTTVRRGAARVECQACQVRARGRALGALPVVGDGHGKTGVNTLTTPMAPQDHPPGGSTSAKGALRNPCHAHRSSCSVASASQISWGGGWGRPEVGARHKGGLRDRV